MGGEENPRTSHGGEKGGEENLRTSHRVERGGEENLRTSQRATIPRTSWATIPRELAGDYPENWLGGQPKRTGGCQCPTLVRQTGLDLLRLVELQNGPTEMPCLGDSVRTRYIF